MKRTVAVLGATGYTGQEVCRLLARHPSLDLVYASRGRAGQPGEPAEREGLPAVEPLELDRLRGVDGAFVCAPHGAAALLDEAALDRGCRVVDLSADFRLHSEIVHRDTYGPLDDDPDVATRLEALRSDAVYGLTEHARKDVAGAHLIANPGCYPTAVALPLLPLIREGLLDLGRDLIADCKSGLSGAGKVASSKTHFGNVHENFSAYGIGNHRHQPEMRQTLGTDSLLFVPHLLPVFRGILATLWVGLRGNATIEQVNECLHRHYDAEPFVKVRDDRAPTLRDTHLTNRCEIHATHCETGNGGRVVLVSAIDNLVKGAAGQAIQNMNLALGLPETDGLQ